MTTARIAIAEDDPHLRSLVSLALGRRGYEVVACKDGAEALEVISRGGFDLVVSDVNMPRLDGIGLTAALRKRWSKAALPVVLTSVLDEEDDILRGYEAGANEYVIKPYRPSVLQAKVAHLLAERAAGTPVEGPPPGPETQGPTERLPRPFEGYVLERRIGEGGMGVVYAAVRRADGRRVALKVLAPELADDRGSLARYFREVATLTWVESPHVVRVLDAGHFQGRYFLAMEHLEGETAYARMRRLGRLDPREAAAIGADVARAIDALLEKGLVHRDVKPANVILTPDRGAVLIDFGLAKQQAERGLTGTDDLLGTAEYLAPEVVKGQFPDAVSDLYALGVTLFELLTGERPTPGETPSEIFHHLLFGWTPPRVSDHRLDVPVALEELVDALLAQEPADRLQDPAEVARELDAVAKGG